MLEFDDQFTMFDITPLENIFIDEYMLRAPGDFVKVYLYGLMLCYHHAERMSLASMARDLDVASEVVFEEADQPRAKDRVVIDEKHTDHGAGPRESVRSVGGRDQKLVRPASTSSTSSGAGVHTSPCVFSKDRMMSSSSARPRVCA